MNIVVDDCHLLGIFFWEGRGGGGVNLAEPDHQAYYPQLPGYYHLTSISIKNQVSLSHSIWFLFAGFTVMYVECWGI